MIGSWVQSHPLVLLLDCRSLNTHPWVLRFHEAIRQVPLPVFVNPHGMINHGLIVVFPWRAKVLNGELWNADFVALVADPLGNHTAGTLDLLLWGPLMIAGALMMLQKRRSMVRILLLVQIRPRSHCVVLRVALRSFDLIHVQPYHLRNASWVSSNDTLTLMLYLIWCLANLSGYSHLRSGRRCTLVGKSVPWCVGGIEIARSKGDLVTGGFRW